MGWAREIRPTPLYGVREGYWQGPASAQALTSAAWKATPSPSARYRPRAVSIWDFQLSLATTPWVRLPTTVLIPQSVMADCRYSSKRVRSQSVRAQMEPLIGLKASCPSLEPATVSQAVAASRWGTPTGSTKLSDRNWKTPVEPGAGAQPQPSIGVNSRLLKKPSAQSPMM